MTADQGQQPVSSPHAGCLDCQCDAALCVCVSVCVRGCGKGREGRVSYRLGLMY